MTVTKSASWEHLADETVLTSANSAGTGSDPQLVSVSNSTLTVDDAQAAAGSKSVRVNSSASGFAYIYLPDAQNFGGLGASGRLYVRFTGALPTVDLPLMAIDGPSSVRACALVVNGAAKLRLWPTTGTTNLWTAAAALVLDQWYEIQLRALLNATPSSSNGTVQVKYGTWDPATKVATNVETMTTLTNINLGSGPTLADVRVAKASTSSHLGTYWVDEFKASDDGTAFIGSWTEVVDAGPDQVGIAPFSTVTLTGVGTGSWSQTGGSPTVTLGGSGAIRTFTAPATVDGTTLTFSYGGDTMTVTVQPHNEWVGAGGSRYPLVITTPV